MKQWFKTTPVGVLVILLLLTFVVNAIAIFLGYKNLPNVVKLVTLISLLIFYFISYTRMQNVFLTIFLLFFLGDIFSIFSVSTVAHKITQSSYLGSYFLIIFVLLGKIKKVKYDGVVSLYLIMVLLLNSYFLYVLYREVQGNFTDSVDVTLYVCHGIALIAMAFFSFASYLSNETPRTITFLIMVFCFVFSDVLSYIGDLYLYYWIFDLLQTTLHLVALVLLYRYVCEHQKIYAEIKTEEIVSNNSSQYSADIIKQ